MDGKGCLLKALVLGHESDEVLVQGLVGCLMQFESISVEAYPTCALFTLQLFSYGSPLREQVLCIVQRTRTFDQLPGLLRIRTTSQHAPFCEHSIERRHAAIHAGTRDSPNHSIPYDSVRGLRKRDIGEIFEDTPESVKKFAKTFYKHARGLAQCINSLGFAAHPSIAQYAADSGDGFVNLSHDAASSIIYRAEVF